MGVEFNEHQPLGYNYPIKKQGGLSNFIIKLGLAKNQSGANLVMIIIAIICFVLAIYISFFR